MSQERNFIFKPHEYCESRMQRDNVLMAENSQDCSLGKKWLHISMWIELRRHREGDQKMTSGEVSQKKISGEKKCGTKGQKDMGGGGPGLGIKNYSSISLPIACCKIATSRNDIWVTEEGKFFKILWENRSQGAKADRKRSCRGLKRSSMEAKYAGNQVWVIVMPLPTIQHTELTAEWVGG